MFINQNSCHNVKNNFHLSLLKPKHKHSFEAILNQASEISQEQALKSHCNFRAQLLLISINFNNTMLVDLLQFQTQNIKKEQK